jgi:hypothetical protein
MEGDAMIKKNIRIGTCLFFFSLWLLFIYACDENQDNCTPTTCAAQGANCGTIDDGCGTTLECGTCTLPDTCGGGGADNVCGCIADCTDRVCGSDGCGGSCGTCAEGSCNSEGLCADAGLVCNRTDGVAPLAVFCDATGGDHGFDAFHDHGYSWDFGDPNAGTWSTTNRSKNTARGPMAAHVFETPGTYTIAVSVKDSNGGTTVRSETITVQDPDVVFAGTATVCFSTGSDFTGCPSGAEHVTLTAFETAIGRAAPGMRLLFRRGDTFSGAGRAYLDETGPGIIGAFGSGSAPAIDMTYTGGLIQLADGNPELDDWRIMDLRIDGHGSGDVFDAENTINRITFLRLAMSNLATSMVISSSKTDFYGTPAHRGVAIVDCSLQDMSGYGVFVASEQLAVLGNSMVNIYQHIVRSQRFQGAVYSNNYLDSPTADSGHATIMKLHAEAVNDDPAYPRQSSEFVITGNVFVGANNDWNVSIGPQSSSRIEEVHNGIVDGNHFIAGSGNSLHLHLAGNSITVRNNIFDTSYSASDTAVSVVRRGIEPPPHNNHLYHNTCYTANSGGTATCIHVADSASNTLAHNNLLVAPNAGGANVVIDNGTSTNAGGNLELGVSTFVSSTPTKALDFALSSGSAAIDTGLSTGLTQLDYVGAFRDIDGDGTGGPVPDVGAFERSGP